MAQETKEIPFKQYQKLMSEICEKAGEAFSTAIESAGGIEKIERRKVVSLAYGCIQEFGEQCGSLSCMMYESTAATQGKKVRTAEMADLPDYKTVAKNVNGALKTSVKEATKVVEKAVKEVGADTTLKNAARDNAEFAWVPSGMETCGPCISIASRGWQRMSTNALKNGHAEHIHAGCDCQYSVRFDGSSNVEGYDPDAYYEMYENAEGKTPKDKINTMRRILNQRKKATDLMSLNKLSDPIYDIFGAAEESHPEDVERIINKAKSLHVEVREKEGKMAYSPGLRKGEPGQLFISKSDSIGAWLHEERHMLDDEADGFLGFAGLLDVERRTQMEYNAYKVEIDLARKNNREDIAQQLIELCRREIEGFEGEWDEKRLE